MILINFVKGSDVQCGRGLMILSRLLFIVLLSFGISLGAAAQNSKEVRKMKAERTEIKKQIEASEDLLRSTKKDVTSQLNNLALLDAQIIEKQRYIDRLKHDSDSLNAAIRDLQKQLKHLNEELTACKANYRRAMTFVSRTRVKQSRWMFVLMAKDFRDLYRRMRYVSQYSKYQHAQGEVIQQKELVVRKKQQQLMAAKREKEQLLAEGKLQQEGLEKKKDERKDMVEKLNKKKNSIQYVINKNKKKYNDINVRIDRLIKAEIAAAERRRKEEERKRKEAEERRLRAEAAARKKETASKSRKKSSRSDAKSESRTSSSSSSRTATVKFNEADDADVKLSNDFKENRGRLPVPISGGYAVTSRYGTYNVAGLRGVQLDNKGINLTGQKGAQARSIFNGEVVTVANFGGSYTVIIRHGNYYSVYNNLATVSVRRGQKVSTAQHLGRVASDSTGNSVLHFQLRHKTSTLNPQSWIKR